MSLLTNIAKVKVHFFIMDLYYSTYGHGDVRIFSEFYAKLWIFYDFWVLVVYHQSDANNFIEKAFDPGTWTP